MNSGNYDQSGPSGSSFAELSVNSHPTGERTDSHQADQDRQAEEEARFRRNREESLQLCNEFHAFYGTHSAYHIDL